MATAMFRSSILSTLRGRAPRVTPAPKRTFSSHASVEEEAREASKWEKITYVAIISSTILAVVNLSKGHPHSEEPPHAVNGTEGAMFSLLNFPLENDAKGPDGLFESKHH
uniref:Cytochrome-c oxidase n=1 Tax=Solanum tuberosum TaxID=4113 RepID=M1D0L5_SOLTU